REKFESALRDRETAWTTQESELQARHQAELRQLRELHRVSLAQQGKHFENEMMRLEEGWKVSMGQLREKHQTEVLEVERQLLETQLSVKTLKDRIAKMESEDAGRLANFEADQARLEAEYLEREKALES